MTSGHFHDVHIVGGGLAGSEAGWQLAQAGVPVVLHEMRPLRVTPVHKTDGYAELVCSNSFSTGMDSQPPFQLRWRLIH